MLSLLIAAIAQSAVSPTPCAPGSVCEVAVPISAIAAEALLGDHTKAWWVADDLLTVVARRDGEATLCCAVQMPLHPVGRGLQAVSVKIPDIDTAIIDIAVIPLQRQHLAESFRGRSAPPPPPRSDPAAVPIANLQLNSAHIGPGRDISVYVPPGISPGQRIPVIYMADDLWPSLAQIADAQIRQGRVAPVILVGVYNRRRTEPPACPEFRCDLRNQELLIDLPGATPEQSRFDLRARFTLEELIPYIESHYPVLRSREGRAVMGRSSGGAWAVTIAARHPDAFGNVIGLSVGWAPAAQSASQLGNTRIFLAAGRLERERFRTQTMQAAERARRAGAEVKLMTLNAGHDFGQWEIAFAEALVWMFPATGGQ